MWKVLLVEDEKEAMRYLRRIIHWEDYGFSVIGEARNGIEALEWIENHPPHLVISDIMMAGMDGVELLRLTRERGLDIKFIMMTCVSEFEFARKALEYGASNYLLKLTVDQITLVSALEKVAKELKEKYKLEKISHYINKSGNLLSEIYTDHPQINRILKIIYEKYTEPLFLQDLAEIVHLDASYLSDLFKKKTGQSLTQFIQKVRVDASLFMLDHTDLAIGTIGEKVGFQNDNYFNRIFRKWMKMTPNEFRKRKK